MKLTDKQKLDKVETALSLAEDLAYDVLEILGNSDYGDISQKVAKRLKDFHTKIGNIFPNGNQNICEIEHKPRCKWTPYAWRNDRNPIAVGECGETFYEFGDTWRYCPACGRILVREHKSIPLPKPCAAGIWHGPGHQSWTRCELPMPHDVHEAVFGSYDQTARWRGDEICSGMFDEAPDCTEDEEN